MEGLTSVESITKWLTEQVQDKQPIGPEVWLEAASSINVLLQGEQEKLFDLEQEVARLRNLLLESGKSVAHARSMIEATPEYKEARKQKAKVERALELIRVSKLQARMSNDAYKAQ